MKNRLSGKILAVLLAVLLCGCICPPTALAADEAPLIYLPDFTELALFATEGNSMREVFSVSSVAFARTVTSMAADFVIAAEDTPLGVQRLIADIDELLYPISCNAEGDSLDPHVAAARNVAAPFSAADNSLVNRENLQAILAAAGPRFSTHNLYIFNYDWRFSPLDNAALLADYIDEVLAGTGGRATLLAGGYGGVVANAYLSEKPDHAKQSVSRIVMLDSFLMGSTLIGDLMSGKFTRAAANSAPVDNPFEILKPTDKTTDSTLKEAIKAYVTEDPNGIAARAMKSLTEDSEYTALFTRLALTLLSSILSDEGSFGSLAAGLKHIASEYETEVLDSGLRIYLRNMPGLWALVPAEDFDAAMTYLFGAAAPAETLLEQIEAYRAVQNRAKETLRAAADAGVAIAFAAGYNRQILPLTGTPDEQSDSIAATRYAAPGVTTADVNESAALSATCTVKRHRHASPDGLLNASTCFLPEQTWFIKNHRHMDYAEPTTAAFVAWLLTCSSSPTVHDNPQYPQYLMRSLIDKSILPYMQADSPVDFMYGDINDDGFVTAEDARMTLRFAVGIEFPTKLMAIAADVDNDDYISAADARLILRFAVGLDLDFPVERI